MERGKKMVLLAHCLLNINAKVVGLAKTQAGSAALVAELMKRGYGIIQLPCPEQLICGGKRWGQVKEQLAHAHFRQSCRRLLEPLVQQVEDYAFHGYQIAGVIGIDGSPSCGVHFTCRGEWGGELTSPSYPPENLATLRYVSEPGVMMEELKEMFVAAHLTIPFFAVDEDAQQEDVDVEYIFGEEFLK